MSYYIPHRENLSGVGITRSLLTNTMKKLSEIYKELGIAFAFPIWIQDTNGYETYYETGFGYWYKTEYDSDGNKTYYETSKGFWYKHEYDSDGELSYRENSYGDKQGTPRSAKTCEGKVIEIDGIKYELKLK